jgi:hypothetical protein
MKKYKATKDFHRPKYNIREHCFEYPEVVRAGDIFDADEYDRHIDALVSDGFIEEVKEENPVDEILLMLVSQYLLNSNGGINAKNWENLDAPIKRAKQAICKAQIDHLLRYGFGDGKHQNMYKHIRGFWGVEEEA